jgi:hypothetical protein
MHKFGIVTLVVCLLPAVLMAQEAPSAPKAEIFGGYSYLRNNSNGFNGWEGQGTVNFSRHLGITAQFDGNYRNALSGPLSSITSITSFLGISPGVNQHFYDFLVGPTATARFGKNAVFAHALFGGAHSSLSAGVGLPFVGGLSSGVTSATGFAMDFGGGIDIGLTRHIALRAAQVDYLQTRFNAADALSFGLTTSTGARQNNFRYSAGIVFRF